MAQGIASWSTSAGANGTADATIGMQEGMSPSAVNDGVRALMARVKEYSLDISGALVTSGSSTAYTLASNEGFASLALLASQPMVAFAPHVTNGATVSLNVDGLGAKPLRYGPGLELQSGMLIAATPYVAVYNATDSAFYLRGIPGNPYGVPLGAVLPYGGTTAPNSAFALCFGQAISRTGFPTLFSLFGTTYGPGDGSTTFNIMDLRGRSIFGLDNMGGSAASRITVAGENFDGTVVGGTGGAQNHTLAKSEIPTGLFTMTDPGHTHNMTMSNGPGPTDATEPAYAGGGGIFNEPNAQTNTTGITITDHAGGGAHTILNPCIVLPFIVRVI